MNRAISFACCGFCLVLAIPAATAQGVVRGVFVTPIPNQPLTAVVDTERTMIFPHGETVTNHTLAHIARDRSGQIYTEIRRSLPPQPVGVVMHHEPQLLSVLIYDPKSRLSTMLNVLQKTIRQNIVPNGPRSLPPDFDAAPQAAQVLPNEYVKQEDLGWQKMEGLNVHGVREVQTIPAEQSGTGKQAIVTDEYWYSDDLRLNLMTKHDDPRTGSSTKTVTNISRNEPDPAIFTVPSDYTFATQAPGAGATRSRVNLGRRATDPALPNPADHVPARAESTPQP